MLSVRLSLLSVLFLSLTTSAQNKEANYKHELIVISENDSYTFRRIDRYYSNGLFFRYANALTKSGATKRILNIEIGQELFTPYSIKRNYQTYLDRPYTAFLYAKGGITYLKGNENVLRWNVLTGFIGKAALGQPTQILIHKLMNFVKPAGWNTQLKTELGINLQGSYHYHIGKATNEKKWADIYSISEGSLGTTYTNLSQGFLLRLGAIEPSYQSAWWQGRITREKNNDHRDYELFFYLQPVVQVQAYNSTIQGGVFTEDDPYITSINPVVYSHKFGGMYAQGKCTVQLGYTFTTKNATTMRTNSTYGTIHFGYRF